MSAKTDKSEIFANKYNFDLKNEFVNIKSNESSKIDKKTNQGDINKIEKFNQEIKLNEIMTKIESQIKNSNIEEDNPNSLKVQIQIDNEEDVKRIKVDSKTYYQNLRRKVILNYKLCSLFIDNFYRDDFSLSRKSSYFLLGLSIFFSEQ
jgi:hypothetical protein